MVNRPPPRPRAVGVKDNDESFIMSSSRRNSRRKTKSTGPRPGLGLEWSLRSLHKIDTGAQHFQSNYYGGSDDEDNGNAGSGDDDEEDQSAYEIFKGPDAANGTKHNEHPAWATLAAPLCVGLGGGIRTG